MLDIAPYATTCARLPVHISLPIKRDTSVSVGPAGSKPRVLQDHPCPRTSTRGHTWLEFVLCFSTKASEEQFFIAPFLKLFASLEQISQRMKLDQEYKQHANSEDDLQNALLLLAYLKRFFKFEPLTANSQAYFG